MAVLSEAAMRIASARRQSPAADRWLPWLMILPAALVLGTFHIFPVLYLVWMSLFKWSFNPEMFLGLGNYMALAVGVIGTAPAGMDRATWAFVFVGM